MRVKDSMSRSCRIGTRDDGVFGFLVFRLRGTVDPLHEGDHTCTHSVHEPSADDNNIARGCDWRSYFVLA